jgi:hypothetical protein
VVLETALLGGAVATNVRGDNPLFSHELFGLHLGVPIWLGLWLRDGRVRALLPLRLETARYTGARFLNACGFGKRRPAAMQAEPPNHTFGGCRTIAVATLRRMRADTYDAPVGLPGIPPPARAPRAGRRAAGGC